MSRTRSPTQIRKDKLRLRDRRRYHKRGVCAICNKITITEIHHFKYSDKYDERSLIEVCHEHHQMLDQIKRGI